MNNTSESHLDEERLGPVSLESELRYIHDQDMANDPLYPGTLLCRRREAALGQLMHPPHADQRAKMVEYSRRNMQHAKAVGAVANTMKLMEMLSERKSAPKWLIERVEGIFNRIEFLSGDLAAWRDMAPDRPTYVDGSTNTTGVYLLQDTRSYVGNAPMWWSGSGGYTSRIDRAQRYTLTEAMAQHRVRETDLPWAFDEIRPLWTPVIDAQYLPRDHAAQREHLKGLKK